MQKLLLCPVQGPQKSLCRPMQQIAMRMRKKYPQTTFTTVAVDDKRVEVLKSTQLLGFRCKYDVGTVSNTASRCDFSIVASGSATLQVAAAGCPMVIMYQSNKILWHLVGRWLVKTKYLSLVNILAGKELVPEFMPYFSSIEPIVERIEQLLKDKSGLSQLSSELIKLAEPMHQANASEKAAQIVIEMFA
jgi:lipid-A-disaccharide synthase